MLRSAMETGDTGVISRDTVYKSSSSAPVTKASPGASPPEVAASTDANRPQDQFALAYDELRRMAELWFRGQPIEHTLQPTALVHEAFLRIAKSDGQYRDATHLLATVARAMRQILVDHARRRGADKRSPNRTRVMLIEEALGSSEDEPGVDVERLHDSLERLRVLSSRQADIVELRYFGGLTVKETADVIGVAPRTVKLDWQFARAWLHGQLSRSPE